MPDTLQDASKLTGHLTPTISEFNELSEDFKELKTFHHLLTERVKKIEERKNFLEKENEQLREQKNIVEAKTESKESLEVARFSPHNSATAISASRDTAPSHAEQTVLSPAYHTDLINYEKPSSLMIEKAFEEKLVELERKFTFLSEQVNSSVTSLENQLSQNDNTLKEMLLELQELSTFVYSADGDSVTKHRK